MIPADKAKLLLALLLIPARLYAAPPEFQIDIKELDRQKPAAPKAVQKPAPKQHKQAPKKKEPEAKAQHEAKKEHPAPAGEYVRYTIKPGDHIFKILVGHFGMSNEAAERLVPEIIELNDIKNIKTLEVGRTLLIPSAPLHGAEAKPTKKEKARPHAEGPSTKAKAETPKEAKPAPAQAPRAPEPAAGPPRAPEPAAEPPRAPEPATPAVPKAAPAPVPAPAPKAPVPAVPQPAPAPAAKSAPAPQPPAAAQKSAPAPAAAPTAAPAIQQAPTWVCSVSRHDAASVVDSVLNALSAAWSRNKIIQSATGAATPFSIRVDRYFEYKGNRYIVSIGENDPYNYTLIRILETAGYRVLMLTGKEDFKTVTERLFKLVGVAPEFGPHALQEGKHATGFMVQQDDAAGRRVLITDTAPPAGHKWVMPAGCGAK
ncbi:LysM peptidoglycan-binding domain-containing protein [Geomonas anaerohicana]|uniref:LysM peptidoglycan-binding domain-containing protein n=1 Tax=Geomonas anaerohicana TaxID=2798583 RepID=A0ABS0Y979_9BACT|nr:LysM peptidoglycan-binding domain-containing protein [Geomonas anaerohicana]MBJ6748848.1 LysM peptidoglycan-binding domain-containing protein [Geomonas anaerohicana]